jgi:hypothetical protein
MNVGRLKQIEWRRDTILRLASDGYTVREME